MTGHSDGGSPSIDVVRTEYEQLIEANDYSAAAMAALEIALLLHRDGLLDEARAAYHEALTFRVPEVIDEARRRVGWESPAAQAYDLVLKGSGDDAAALLTRVYEPSNVAGFGLAVCEGYFDEAADMIYGMGGDLEISDAGQIAIDMAGRYLRDENDEAAGEALALVAATDFTSELWDYAIDSGSFVNSRVAVEVGTTLLQLTLEKRDIDRAIAIAERSAASHPKVTVIGYRLLVSLAEQEADSVAAVRWKERLGQFTSG
ncbi:hypothetical protein [Actinomadura verrucosospora]|uniref:hypothetical protein n=1 Tax=Actinomadura verrucosospora TaxID=46165 RepID=UPI001565C934|nr:hypothetical protein [Actinomadura verrucosospora]